MTEIGITLGRLRFIRGKLQHTERGERFRVGPHVGKLVFRGKKFFIMIES